MTLPLTAAQRCRPHRGPRQGTSRCAAAVAAASLVACATASLRRRPAGTGGADAGLPSALVVLDCGSTGTRAHVFEVAPRGGTAWALRVAEPEARSGPLRSDVALHHLVGLQADAIWEKISPLIVAVERRAPRGAELRALATAGVRALGRTQRAELLGAVRAALLRSSLNVGDVRVMSGDEEGLYGWVAVNYLWNASALSSLEGTMGALDVGGGSMQAVALQPPAAPEGAAALAEEAEGAARGPVAELRRRLYIRSYQGYGAARMEAGVRERIAADARASPDATSPWPWPCGFSGHDSLSSQQETNLGAPPSAIGSEVRFRGAGDFPACEARVRVQLRERQKSSGALRAVPEVLRATRWVGMSLLHHVTKFLSLANPSPDGALPLPHPSPSVAELRRGAAALCRAEWATVLESMRGRDPGTTERRMPGRCFDAALAVALLGPDGCGFEDHSRGITFVGTVHGAEVEWSLGAAIAAVADSRRQWPDAWGG
eukprot:TRINITY_DN8629_c0_g2_i2.p2 TRINITY_DN8629_c0_g2~~TRINITY_DN8629_c0_g2_i2.p2  ORF type:complete len:513 (+),score=147.11 TRINITY_DN8629_c0_g2_i2:74-1540(+)